MERIRRTANSDLASSQGRVECSGWGRELLHESGSQPTIIKSLPTSLPPSFFRFPVYLCFVFCLLGSNHTKTTENKQKRKQKQKEKKRKTKAKQRRKEKRREENKAERNKTLCVLCPTKPTQSLRKVLWKCTLLQLNSEIT